MVHRQVIRHWRDIKRPTIARNTSGFSRKEVMKALRLVGPKPSASLLLDLTLSHRGTHKGWCLCTTGRIGEFICWDHKGTEYKADCMVRLRIANRPSILYTLRTGRGRRLTLTVTRWQALCLLLAHEIAHWKQAVRDGRGRCLQIDADRNALRIARKLGLRV